jgi:hypothetical protein
MALWAILLRPNKWECINKLFLLFCYHLWRSHIWYFFCNPEFDCFQILRCATSDIGCSTLILDGGIHRIEILHVTNA